MTSVIIINPEARREWDTHIKGRNFMTPHPLAYGYTKDGDVWELSEGTDFDHVAMYGVSILTLATGRIDSDQSTLFNYGTPDERRASAISFVEAISGT